MGLETGTYIDSLVATNPLNGDFISDGDDHLRLVKSTIKNTLPNIAGAVTPTHTELNYVDGVTSAIQTQLDGKQSSDGTILKDADIGSSVQAYDANTAKLDVQQEYSRSQHYTPAALTDGATISWDLATQPDATLMIAGNRTMSLPTNIEEGKSVAIRVRQDATGNRMLAWNAAFLWGDDGAPTLSTGANKYDIITFKGLSASQLMFTGIKKGF